VEGGKTCPLLSTLHEKWKENGISGLRKFGPFMLKTPFGRKKGEATGSHQTCAEHVQQKTNGRRKKNYQRSRRNTKGNQTRNKRKKDELRIQPATGENAQGEKEKKKQKKSHLNRQSRVEAKGSINPPMSLTTSQGGTGKE